MSFFSAVVARRIFSRTFRTRFVFGVSAPVTLLLILLTVTACVLAGCVRFIPLLVDCVHLCCFLLFHSHLVLTGQSACFEGLDAMIEVWNRPVTKEPVLARGIISAKDKAVADEGFCQISKLT